MLSLDCLRFIWRSTLIEIWKAVGFQSGFQYRITRMDTGDSRLSHYYSQESEAIAAAKLQSLYFEIDDADAPCGLICSQTDVILRLSFVAIDCLGDCEGESLRPLLDSFWNFKCELMRTGRCYGQIANTPILATTLTTDLSVYWMDLQPQNHFKLF